MKDQNHLEKTIAAALGEVRSEFVLKSGRIFDVITGEYIEGDVAIVGKKIVGVGKEYQGDREMDVSGKILVPGFIDTHLHIESSLVTPLEFERCVVPHGVTTAICDPHEIANVIGAEGVRYFQKASERTLMDIRVQIPSCVPSTNMETSGAELTAADIASLRGHQSEIGLAEMMNFPGVVHRDPGIMAKIKQYEAQHIDGHCPLLTGAELNGYIAAGIRTEHEATTFEEAKEKLQKGMRVLLREGSVSKDLKALQPLLTERTSAYMCLCTDDRNPLDIAEYGHLDYMIRTLIAMGTTPIAAYRAASLSAAEAFGLKDRGLVAPGLRADIVILDDLNECKVHATVCGGTLADEESFAKREPLTDIGRGSVKAKMVVPENFRVKGNRSETNVIGIIDGKILTEHLRVEIEIVDGDKKPDAEHDLARISIVERHGKNGNISNGFVRGFGLKQGAIASTVCHDHHNIACIGTNYGDMAIAANRLVGLEGGFVVVLDGTVLAELALPIAGLMSDKPFEVVRESLVKLRSAARELGVAIEEPFLQLAFVALPVIPALKITDFGLVDVHAFEVISP